MYAIFTFNIPLMLVLRYLDFSVDACMLRLEMTLTCVFILSTLELELRQFCGSP